MVLHNIFIIFSGNTVNFDPSHVPAEMRIIAAQPNLKKYVFTKRIFIIFWFI